MRNCWRIPSISAAISSPCAGDSEPPQVGPVTQTSVDYDRSPPIGRSGVALSDADHTAPNVSTLLQGLEPRLGYAGKSSERLVGRPGLEPGTEAHKPLTVRDFSLARLWIRCSSGDMIGLCGSGRGSRGCTHLHLENPTALDGRSGSASPDNIRFYNWMHRPRGNLLRAHRLSLDTNR